MNIRRHVEERKRKKLVKRIRKNHLQMMRKKYDKRQKDTPEWTPEEKLGYRTVIRQKKRSWLGRLWQKYIRRHHRATVQPKGR